MIKKDRFLAKFLKIFYYIVFIVLFSIACTAIIFYASGYKVNLKAGKIQKNGMILIDYEKDDISIMIDGKNADYVKGKQGFWAPSNYIISTLPGKYSLEIRAPGKRNYVENIIVEEEKITKIENLVMIPEQIKEQKALEETISQYCISDNGKKIVYEANEKFFYYNIETGIKKQLPNDFSSNSLSTCSWNSKNEKVILENTAEKNPSFYVFDSENDNGSFYLHNMFSFVPSFEKIYFSNGNSNIAVGLADKEIYRVNIDSKNIDSIDKNVSNIIKNNFIFYMKDEEKNVYRIDQTTYSKDVVIENYEWKKDFEIVFANDNNIFVKDGNLLYRVENRNNMEIIDKEIGSSVKSKRDYGFFYLKGFELWFYDIGKKKDTIVSRFSQPIKKAETYHSSYIIHSSPKELGLIRETGLNDQSVKTENEISDFEILDKEKILLITKDGDGFTLKILDLEII